MNCAVSLATRRMQRSLLFLIFSLLSLVAFAQDGLISIEAYPSAIVADGVSTLTLTITVRDKNGNNAPDGTRVLVESTLGALRRNQLETKNGLVQVQLTAGTLPGEAIVTASVPNLRASSRLGLKFVRSRSELDSSAEVIEMRGPQRLTYATESQIARTDGPNQTVELGFGKLKIRADDLQLNTRTLEIMAKNAKVEGFGETRNYKLLNFNLRSRTGSAVKEEQRRRYVYKGIPPFFRVDVFEETRPVLVNLSQGTEERVEGAAIPLALFQFSDIYAETTLIYARKLVFIYPRELQFTSAVVDVNGTSVLNVPRFRLSATSKLEVITDEFLTVANNQVALNFPYYLGLSVGSESLFRLRYGSRFSRGVGGIGGLFLDFERSWNQVTEAPGALAVRGIGRNDWSLSLRQRVAPTKSLRSFLQADYVANRSLLGSAIIDQAFRDFRLSYNASASRSLRGSRFESVDQTINLATNPFTAKGTGLSLNLGITASERQSRSNDNKQRQRLLGADLFGNFRQLQFGQANLSNSFRLSKNWGFNAREGITTSLFSSLSMPIGQQTFLGLNYEFSDDPFVKSTLGSHRVSSSLSIGASRFFADVFSSASLDGDRYTLQADASYRVSALWRLIGTTTLEGFSGSRFQDSGVTVAYTVGSREVGVSYSLNRRRIGLEFLGTRFR